MDSVLKDSYLTSFYHTPATKAISDLFESRSSSRKQSSSTVKESNSPSYNVLDVPNSKALVSALKTLQEKISRLELDKYKAQNCLTSLSMENSEQKKALSEKEKSEAAQREALRQKSDVITQLNSAEQRCSLLEKQLDYMRKMVHNAEMEKNTVLEQQTFLQQGNIQDKLEKLEFLEEECLRLTATQQAAESKIHQLEEKLYAEEQQRKLMETKAVQLESGLEMNRIFLSAAAQNASQRKEKKKKQLQKKPAVSKPTPDLRMSLKAGDLPFVAGKSTSTSHSLSANVQSVMHMIKHQSQSPHSTQTRSKSAGHKPVSLAGTSRSSACAALSTGDSLTDLLHALQGELEDMNFEYDELLKQINETKDTDMREDLEREMECLVKQMETKSDQILKLKRHQQNVLRLKKAAQSMTKLSSNARSALTGQSCKGDSPVTLVKKQEASARSSPAPSSNAALQLLKNVQKIQTNLKKDDIMWEK
ncbi:PREDICTED: centrosomal protein CEP57L1 isoform X1 [Nanorana parkeri]|uniref:centrosomal protein CEP57L1 isoform X1 n=1 Tax=Nanorana parkeri TaxID=125878 RepID=UPI000854A1B1|nr:PREDICTED: centrosomal protein CEP57L1 isoform X1 [Nanorana parkeri]